jgi:hypothetical protein
MRVRLKEYLARRYRRDVLHASAQVTPLEGEPDIIEEIEAEIARIDALRLGPHLPNRDFASYQTKRFLGEVLDELQVSGRLRGTEMHDTAVVTGGSVVSGTLAATDARDTANFDD